MDYKKYIKKDGFDKQEIRIARQSEHSYYLEYVENIMGNSLFLAVDESLNKREAELEKEYRLLFSDGAENASINQVDIVNTQLIGIYEVKIIYLYKSLEINLKKIISAAYYIEFTKQTKWDNLTGMLESNGINFNGRLYDDIKELRHVNNSSKHSYKEISSEMLKIKEFKEIKEYANRKSNKASNKPHIGNIYFDDLKVFYERVEKSPNLWLSKIIDEIKKERFEFSNQKLEKMALDLALRLDEGKAMKLIENLKRMY